jgi:hypothetical protein
MADPNVTSGRPTGDSQSHDHLKRDRTYSFQSGGTVQGGIDTENAPVGADSMDGYSPNKGGGTVKH